jgi:hypothetical protein
MTTITDDQRDFLWRADLSHRLRLREILRDLHLLNDTGYRLIHKSEDGSQDIEDVRKNLAFAKDGHDEDDPDFFEIWALMTDEQIK